MHILLHSPQVTYNTMRETWWRRKETKLVRKILDMKVCKNCNHQFELSFCNKCGQKAEVKRLNGKVMLEEVAHFFTHIEHAFIATSKKLLIHPGETANNYLQGQRKKYQPPLSYITIWVAVVFVVRGFIIKHYNYKVNHNPYINYNTDDSAFFYGHHSSIFIFIISIATSFVIYFIMSRPKYNFWEIIAVNFYYFGTYLILQLFLGDILLGIFFHVNIQSWQYGMICLVIGAFWSFWCIYQFHRNIRMKFFLIRLIVCAVLSDVTAYSIVVFGPALWLHIINK
jgi:hypothetical protein